MIRNAQRVFVDTGAWIAMALVADPYHARAVEIWEELLAHGARLTTSVPVVLETFTFLDRNARRDVALAWKDSFRSLRWFKVLSCAPNDVEQAWAYFRRSDLHKLSAVDATSFILMSRHKIPYAFAFDHHFLTVGFRLVG
jgi:predicted nucleic acid-binding protein